MCHQFAKVEPCSGLFGGGRFCDRGRGRVGRYNHTYPHHGRIDAGVPNHLAYENDGMSVWSNQSAARRQTPRRRRIDLNAVTQEITGATSTSIIQNPDVNNTATLQVATSLHVHGGLTSLTWNNMATYTEPPALAPYDFESFGRFSIASGQPNSQYYSSDAASANDLIELNAMRTDSEKKLTMFLMNNSGSGLRDWGDAAHGGAAQLVVTTLPEPSTIMLLAIGLLSLLAYAWRQRT